MAVESDPFFSSQSSNSSLKSFELNQLLEVLEKDEQDKAPTPRRAISQEAKNEEDSFIENTWVNPKSSAIKKPEKIKQIAFKRQDTRVVPKLQEGPKQRFAEMSYKLMSSISAY